MKQITYAGSTFVTGSAIADALTALTAALGVSSETTTVTVPAIDAVLGRTTVDLVIGPSSELFAVDLHADGDELVDAETGTALEARSWRPPRPLPTWRRTPTCSEHPGKHRASRPVLNRSARA
jgi:hypothetical protein